MSCSGRPEPHRCGSLPSSGSITSRYLSGVPGVPGLAAPAAIRPQTVPQVAVLRFENLSVRSISRLDGSRLCRNPSRPNCKAPRTVTRSNGAPCIRFDASLGGAPGAPGISAERTGALVAGANEIVYGDFSVVNGILHATATEEDLPTHKMVLVASASGPPAAAFSRWPTRWPASWARRVRSARENAQALRDFVAALESPDPAAASAGFCRRRWQPIQISGGPTCSGWTQPSPSATAPQADRIVEQARAHQDRFSALDRAELDLDAAALRGDFHAATGGAPRTGPPGSGRSQPPSRAGRNAA